MNKQQAGMLWPQLPAGLWEDPTLSDDAKLWLAAMISLLKSLGLSDWPIYELDDELDYGGLRGLIKELKDHDLIVLGPHVHLAASLFPGELSYEEYLRSPAWLRRARDARARAGNRAGQ